MEFNYLVERTRMLNSLGRKGGIAQAYDRAIEIVKGA